MRVMICIEKAKPTPFCHLELRAKGSVQISISKRRKKTEQNTIHSPFIVVQFFDSIVQMDGMQANRIC